MLTGGNGNFENAFSLKTSCSIEARWNETAVTYIHGAPIIGAIANASIKVFLEENTLYNVPG